ncbi:alpha/beta fold hydrolase [Streptomyces albidoflavus]
MAEHHGNVTTEHHVTEVGGVRLAHRVSGPPQAPPLVLLHALGETAADWDAVTATLAREHRVHALDLRGHGRSDWPGEYSLPLMRDDVRGFLDALELDRVDLVGHSLGGIVAHLLAAEHPRRVAGLVLEDVPAPRPRPATTPVRPDGELAFDWDMVPVVRRQIDTPDPAWLGGLGRITADTLVVAGGPDSPVPQENVAELARRIPRGRLVTLPVGHLVHRSAPTEFTHTVLAFLRSRQ